MQGAVHSSAAETALPAHNVGLTARSGCYPPAGFSTWLWKCPESRDCMHSFALICYVSTLLCRVQLPLILTSGTPIRTPRCHSRPTKCIFFQCPDCTLALQEPFHTRDDPAICPCSQPDERPVRHTESNGRHSQNDAPPNQKRGGFRRGALPRPEQIPQRAATLTRRCAELPPG